MAAKQNRIPGASRFKRKLQRQYCAGYQEGLEHFRHNEASQRVRLNLMRDEVERDAGASAVYWAGYQRSLESLPNAKQAFRMYALLQGAAITKSLRRRLRDCESVTAAEAEDAVLRSVALAMSEWNGWCVLRALRLCIALLEDSNAHREAGLLTMCLAELESDARVSEENAKFAKRACKAISRC